MPRLWKTASASRLSSVCGTLIFFCFQIWIYDLLSLLMILMNFEASPTSFLRTLWFIGVTGTEMRTAIFAPWCRCSDSWTAEGVTAGPEGEGGATADWVSRADSRRHGWKKTSCSSVSSHPLIDLGFCWRAQGQFEMNVVFLFHLVSFRFSEYFICIQFSQQRLETGLRLRFR